MGRFLHLPLEKLLNYPPTWEGGEKMENLVSLSVNRKDGHGGRAEEHRAEMEEIARKVFESERAKMLDEI